MHRLRGSVVHVALPAIGASQHADAPALHWLVNAHLSPLERDRSGLPRICGPIAL